MGAATGGLDQPDRLEQQTVVAVAMLTDQVTGRQRHQVKGGALFKRGRTDPAICTTQTQPSHLRQGFAFFQAADQLRHQGLTILNHDRINGSILQRPAEGRGSMTTHDDEGLRRQSPHLAGGCQHPLELQGMQATDPHQTRPAASQPAGHTWAETQVGNGDPVFFSQQGSSNVFKPQRLNAEKRPKTEFIVARMGSQQQNIHPFFLSWP